jgi:hypothetical protein
MNMQMLVSAEVAGEIERTPRHLHLNLGCSIVAVAVNDYRSPNAEVHCHAREFLYPRTREARDHLSWVVAMATGVDEAWLREMLDERRDRWDAQRQRLQRRVL